MINVEITKKKDKCIVELIGHSRESMCIVMTVYMHTLQKYTNGKLTQKNGHSKLVFKGDDTVEDIILWFKSIANPWFGFQLRINGEEVI